MFMAGVCNLVIISQGNILDIFMNAAALIVIMEIDDHVGEYCMQAFSTQTKMLKIESTVGFSTAANMFSTLILISSSVMACIFQFKKTDTEQGWYFLGVMGLCFVSIPVLACLFAILSACHHVLVAMCCCKDYDKSGYDNTLSSFF